MGIDRIGKGGTPHATPEPGAAGVGKLDRKDPVPPTFAVDRPDATETTRAAETHATSTTTPLARLRAGEIDLDGYVDLKVEEATHGLEGLSPAELADIKSVLKDQLVTDPGLTDLVERATGHAPKPPPDE